MVKFKYRYCKVHMARYVAGDLSDAVRRRVARYIDECEDCYREYLGHREFSLKLERNLPTLGRPNPEKLDQVWLSLQAELRAPARHRAWLRDFGTSATAPFNYGLVIVAISIALLLPLTIGYQASLISVELPPAPLAAPIVRTPSTNLAESPSFVGTLRSRPRQRTPALQNTPAPSV